MHDGSGELSDEGSALAVPAKPSINAAVDRTLTAAVTHRVMPGILQASRRYWSLMRGFTTGRDCCRRVGSGRSRPGEGTPAKRRKPKQPRLIQSIRRPYAGSEQPCHND